MNGEHPVEVVRANEHELDMTAFLHVTELPHGLFPRLGRGFVRRWHRAHLRSDYGTVLVARRGGVVVGFLVGTVDRRANVAWIIRRHRTELVAAGLRALAARPVLAWPFLRTRGLRYARRIMRPGASGTSQATDYSQAVPSNTGPDEPNALDGPGSPAPLAVLEAVVVDFPERGNGIGSALVDAFLAEVVAADANRVELVTKADARGAAGFYERSGWSRVGEHVDRDGDEVLTFRFDPQTIGAR
ncbi:GNAT family N-acetyltransferase [Phytoactinopolyspora endophytica]|uniref:GNAT family N-acetyltransferase n=1 Tax=Phytoactinopolyspora endophytica TaxID=1642495 RepID=UPI0013EC2FA9|nr:GNAT family N-acetyltransferase [Phytoactinopolyspora endophytica]